MKIGKAALALLATLVIPTIIIVTVVLMPSTTRKEITAGQLAFNHWMTSRYLYHSDPTALKKQPPFSIYGDLTRNFISTEAFVETVGNEHLKLPLISDATKRGTGFTSEGVAWSLLRGVCPRTMYVHSTLSTDECQQLVKAALPAMERSRVNDANGNPINNGGRTSQGNVSRHAGSVELTCEHEAP